MPYLKKTYFAGKTIEVEKCYTNRYGKKGQKRRDKVKPTSEHALVNIFWTQNYKNYSVTA